MSYILQYYFTFDSNILITSYEYIQPNQYILFVQNIDAAMQTLLGVMKGKSKEPYIKRNDYTMDYKTAAEE